MSFEFSEIDLTELARRDDLSDVFAEIDTTCFRLDFYEMGRWWDYERSCRKLSHPAIAVWMNAYGFKTLDDLPTAALIALAASLRRYLAASENGLRPATIDVPRRAENG